MKSIFYKAKLTKRTFFFTAIIAVFFLFNTCKKKCETTYYRFTEDELSWGKYRITKPKYILNSKDTVEAEYIFDYDQNRSTTNGECNWVHEEIDACTSFYQDSIYFHFDLYAHNLDDKGTFKIEQMNISGENDGISVFYRGTHNNQINEKIENSKIRNKEYNHTYKWTLTPSTPLDIKELWFVKGVGVIYVEFLNGNKLEIID